MKSKLITNYLFSKKMHSLVIEQQEKLHRAVFGHEIKQTVFVHAANEWFAKSPKQREQYIKSTVHNTCLEDTSKEANDQLSKILTSTQPRNDEPCLSRNLLNVSQSNILMYVRSFAKGLSIPFASLEGKWEKTENLLLSAECMALTPGDGYGAEARMVKSTSGKRPHLVKSGCLICDGDCLNYKVIGNWNLLTCCHANNKLIWALSQD